MLPEPAVKHGESWSACSFDFKLEGIANSGLPRLFRTGIPSLASGGLVRRDLLTRLSKHVEAP